MKKIITLSMLFVATALFAQEEETKKFSISGTVDAYYQTYLTSTDTQVPEFDEDGFPTGDLVNQSFGSSFADQTGFALGMANIIASYEGEKTGAVADLVFGTRGTQAAGDGADLYINQLYAYWNVSESTTLTMGRWNTYLGYEVISPSANFNYSTSYLFSSGPFSMVGLKADFALSEDFSLMLAVMNATDVNNNTTGDYSLGAQVGYSGQYLNLYYDSGIVLGFEIDYTGGFDLTEDFFLGINAAYQTRNILEDEDGNVLSTDVANGFYGAALYPQYSVSDAFGIGLRGEYFGSHVEDGEDLPSVIGLTLTGSYSVENLIIKPEVRLDSWSNNLPYFDNDGLPSDNLAAFTLAAIYSF